MCLLAAWAWAACNLPGERVQALQPACGPVGPSALLRPCLVVERENKVFLWKACCVSRMNKKLKKQSSRVYERLYEHRRAWAAVR